MPRSSRPLVKHQSAAQRAGRASSSSTAQRQQHSVELSSVQSDDGEGHNETEELINRRHRPQGNDAVTAVVVASSLSGNMPSHLRRGDSGKSSQELVFDFSEPVDVDETQEKFLRVCNTLSCGVCSQACLSCWYVRC